MKASDSLLASSVGVVRALHLQLLEHVTVPLQTLQFVASVVEIFGVLMIAAA
jgi:hypothetical protein